jgi:hypothetical protein
MWSWWDSLESVAKFDSFLTMLRIIGVIVGALGTMGAAMATGVQYWSGARLNHLKAQRDAEEKAEMRHQLIMEMSVVSQQIIKLEPGNVMLLDDEPVPESVRISVGPLTHFPRERFGYRMEGRQIFITRPETLAQVQQRLPGGVTVDYRKRVKPLETS